MWVYVNNLFFYFLLNGWGDMIIKDMKNFEYDDIKSLPFKERTKIIAEWQKWKKIQISNDRREMDNLKMKIYLFKRRLAMIKLSYKNGVK